MRLAWAFLGLSGFALVITQGLLDAAETLLSRTGDATNAGTLEAATVLSVQSTVVNDAAGYVNAFAAIFLATSAIWCGLSFAARRSEASRPRQVPVSEAFTVQLRALEAALGEIGRQYVQTAGALAAAQQEREQSERLAATARESASAVLEEIERSTRPSVRLQTWLAYIGLVLGLLGIGLALYFG